MINYKNLSKALKYSKSYNIFWFRTEKYSYLLTGFWAIRTTKRLHIEKGIFTTLINLFQDIPAVSEGLQLTHKGLEPIKEERMKGLIELIQDIRGDEIKSTGLITELDYKIREVEILKAPNNYIFIDKVLMDFINMTPETKLYGRGPYNPIYVQNGEELAMLLPVRVDKIPEYLKPVEKEEVTIWLKNLNIIINVLNGCGKTELGLGQGKSTERWKGSWKNMNNSFFDYYENIRAMKLAAEMVADPRMKFRIPRKPLTKAEKKAKRKMKQASQKRNRR